MIEKMMFYLYHAAFENYIFNATIIISFASYIVLIIIISIKTEE